MDRRAAVQVLLLRLGIAGLTLTPGTGMSLHVDEHGTREGILAHIKELGADGKLAPGTDKAQTEAVKSLLLTEIAALPAEFNGLRIHADATVHAGGRNITIVLVPQKLRV
ncbi:MAG TPA: hypothetical protein VG028_13260 [Terriglobia bacterium]|nr:hypothetical protein [Terriglobia bacterium]